MNTSRILEEFNNWRRPRTNALILAAVILLAGFMAYNFISRELTHVAGTSYEPAVATPKPSQVP